MLTIFYLLVHPPTCLCSSLISTQFPPGYLLTFSTLTLPNPSTFSFPVSLLLTFTLSHPFLYPNFRLNVSLPTVISASYLHPPSPGLHTSKLPVVKPVKYLASFFDTFILTPPLIPSLGSMFPLSVHTWNIVLQYGILSPLLSLS